MASKYEILSFYIPEDFSDIFSEFKKLVRVDKGLLSGVKLKNHSTIVNAAMRVLITKYVSQRKHLLQPATPNETANVADSEKNVSSSKI